MEDYKRLTEMVINNHENIAYAISMAYADGDERKAALYYDRFLDTIKNHTECFFMEDKEDFGSKYDPDIKMLLDSISKVTNRDVSKCFFENIGVYRSIEGYSQPEYENSKEYYLYYKRFSEYKLLGIDFMAFKEICNGKTEQEINNLNAYIDSLSMELSMYSTKKLFSIFKFIKKSKKDSSKFVELSKKYGVKNFDELLILNEEVGAFLIDSSKLDDEELECVNKKKDDFRKRISKDSDFVLKRKDAIALQKIISDIYNNKAYEELLRTTNFKDFLDMNNYEYNPKNLDRLLYLYFDMKGNLGSCSKFTFKDRPKSLCLYRGENIVYGTKKNQNNIILHEFIHSLDHYSEDSIEKPFCIDFKYLNEALTEYLSLDAIRYLKGDILTLEEKKVYFPSESSYWCMIPLVKKLEASSIWKHIKVAKLAGDDLDYIERNIGYSDLKRIGNCFDKLYMNRNKPKVKEECMRKLDDILLDIARKKYKKERKGI
jgi:hypothetical protein